jgi:hypothetical protein
MDARTKAQAALPSPRCDACLIYEFTDEAAAGQLEFYEFMDWSAAPTGRND